MQRQEAERTREKTDEGNAKGRRAGEGADEQTRESGRGREREREKTGRSRSSSGERLRKLSEGNWNLETYIRNFAAPLKDAAPAYNCP
ncbi:MAG: hypothetical protein BJ554DRAFT_3161 [Olpidium bornovanus]|uniref:Uncharacterized protein n=1 Tax=Olpidium bornovanus TaxID=278681 RepID=A0A8H8DG42_9FUNG|nr:MAG: hypothetical protein BJ554DRAFT_3161 [Olpidium bornovanus]